MSVDGIKASGVAAVELPAREISQPNGLEEAHVWEYPTRWEIKAGANTLAEYAKNEPEQALGPVVRLIRDNQGRIYGELIGWVRPWNYLDDFKVTIDFAPDPAPLRTLTWDGTPGGDNAVWPDGDPPRRLLMNPGSEPDLWTMLINAGISATWHCAAH
ncbi:hypothetical protein [Paraburkholderia sp. Clong3]|uniref:hypothetical protein n=1 Tax=Paraburkholderia sp. Clong3 TaxID=2991061 RepID=UPI003D2616AC